MRINKHSLKVIHIPEITGEAMPGTGDPRLDEPNPGLLSFFFPDATWMHTG